MLRRSFQLLLVLGIIGFATALGTHLTAQTAPVVPSQPVTASC
jgi:hypothetical protein